MAPLTLTLTPSFVHSNVLKKQTSNSSHNGATTWKKKMTSDMEKCSGTIVQVGKIQLGHSDKIPQARIHRRKRRWPRSSMHTSNNYLSLFYHCLIYVFEMQQLCHGRFNFYIFCLFNLCQSVLIGYSGCWWSSVTCDTNWATSCRRSHFPKHMHWDSRCTQRDTTFQPAVELLFTPQII